MRLVLLGGVCLSSTVGSQRFPSSVTLTNPSQCVNALSQAIQQILKSQTYGSGQAVLWDPPTHLNLGDNFLTLGAEIVLKQIFPTFDLNQNACCAGYCRRLFPRCDDTFYSKQQWQDKPGVLFLQPGGNWGDLYRKVQNKRMSTIHHISDHYSETQIIGMPQSFWYNDGDLAVSDAKALNTAFAKLKHQPVLLWRDRYSYEKASRLYTEATNILTPDMAMAIGSIGTPTPSYDILISMRREESVEGAAHNQATVRTTFDEYPGITYRTSFGWEAVTGHNCASYGLGLWAMGALCEYGTEKRFQLGVHLLGEAAVVVTDKLHMAILSMLMGKNIIYVDNIYQKLNNTLEAMFSFKPEACNDKRWLLKPIKADNYQKAVTMAAKIVQDTQTRIHDGLHQLNDEQGALAVDQLWPRYWLELCSGASVLLIYPCTLVLLLSLRRHWSPPCPRGRC